MNSISPSDRMDRAVADGRSGPIVFVADDDISIRGSIESLIASAGWQAETFASGPALLEQLAVKRPCCMILDTSMSGFSGLDVQKRVADERLEIPLIFITGCADVATAVRAMKAGAVEFLTKPYDEKALLSAVRCAIERSDASQRTQEAKRRMREAYASLTPREVQVMALVVAGLLNKQVGAELGITEVTVKAHRGKLMRKMKADSFAELVRIASELPMPALASLRSRRASFGAIHTKVSIAPFV